MINPRECRKQLFYAAIFDGVLIYVFWREIGCCCKSKQNTFVVYFSKFILYFKENKAYCFQLTVSYRKIVTECELLPNAATSTSKQSNVLLTAWSHEQHVASMQEDMLLKMNRRSTLENERVVLRCCLHYYI